MPYLLKADLSSHLYGENIDEIIRGDDTIVTTAINCAIAEAKGYMSKYDLPRLFDSDNAGYYADANLRSKVKDLACWHLIKLSNPNINLALLRTAFEDAIAWFKQIQKCQVDPEGWPYKPDDPATDYTEAYGAAIISNTPRSNFY